MKTDYHCSIKTTCSKKGLFLTDGHQQNVNEDNRNDLNSSQCAQLKNKLFKLTALLQCFTEHWLKGEKIESTNILN
jgi:hypothetical protein